MYVCTVCVSTNIFKMHNAIFLAELAAWLQGSVRLNNIDNNWTGWDTIWYTYSWWTEDEPP